jgi:mRNA-degrading endonuclease YafQ of YafQ-DinJ toxin-antitoxin module
VTEQPQDRPRVRLVVSPRFRRRAKKLQPDEQRALARALRLFELNPRDQRLDTHKLHGEHDELWAFSFGFDARVVFTWEDGSTAVLLNVGSHDEVYG